MKAAKHDGYDKRSGNTISSHAKKHGHGKGGWGNADELADIALHCDVQRATELLNAEVGDQKADFEQTELPEEPFEDSKIQCKPKIFRKNDADFPSL